MTRSADPRFPLPDELLVYGVRSRYAAEFDEMLSRWGHRGVRFVDNYPDGPAPPEVAPIVDVDDVEAGPGVGVVVPAFDPDVRRRVVADASRRGFTDFPVLVDPTSVVARSARLGEGTTVNAGVVIAAGTVLGRFVAVNRSSSIGHDGVIGDFVSLGPGCVLAGHITIGAGAFVGAGAVLRPHVHVGEGAVVGAGAVVVRDVAPGVTVAGNPARPLG